jgi:hypothetical protein
VRRIRKQKRDEGESMNELINRIWKGFSIGIFCLIVLIFLGTMAHYLFGFSIPIHEKKLSADNTATQFNSVSAYGQGYIDGWNEVARRQAASDRGIYDYFQNIRDVPPQLRGCYLNYYMENANFGDWVYYEWHNSTDGLALYNEDGYRINCSKWE